MAIATNPTSAQASGQSSNREPWLAVLWSRIWPGFGQVYAGARVRGLAIALVHLAIEIACLLSFLGVAGLSIYVGLLGCWLLLFISIFSGFDAYGLARRGNTTEFEAARRSKKDPWLAVFWTTICCGAGHLYTRRYGLGGILIALGVISWVIPFTWLLLPFVAIHAFKATLALNQDRETQPRIGQIVLLAWLLPLLFGVVSAFGLRTFVLEARFIPSGSMQPTLQVHDRLLIDKLTYRLEAPQRGDVVVFKPTKELQRQEFRDAFIQRIVGLPGETVVVKDGQVFVDGEMLDEPYILAAPNYDWRAEDINIPTMIPPGHYFTLGDNRNHSYDGHFWGYVPQEKLAGKATQRFWPIERIGAINRFVSE